MQNRTHIGSWFDPNSGLEDEHRSLHYLDARFYGAPRATKPYNDCDERPTTWDQTMRKVVSAYTDATRTHKIGDMPCDGFPDGFTLDENLLIGHARSAMITAEMLSPEEAGKAFFVVEEGT